MDVLATSLQNVRQSQFCNILSMRVIVAKFVFFIPHVYEEGLVPVIMSWIFHKYIVYRDEEHFSG